MLSRCIRPSNLILSMDPLLYQCFLILILRLTRNFSIVQVQLFLIRMKVNKNLYKSIVENTFDAVSTFVTYVTLLYHRHDVCRVWVKNAEHGWGWRQLNLQARCSSYKIDLRHVSCILWNNNLQHSCSWGTNIHEDRQIKINYLIQNIQALESILNHLHPDHILTPYLLKIHFNTFL